MQRIRPQQFASLFKRMGQPAGDDIRRDRERCQWIVTSCYRGANGRISVDQTKSMTESGECKTLKRMAVYVNKPIWWRDALRRITHQGNVYNYSSSMKLQFETWERCKSLQRWFLYGWAAACAYASLWRKKEIGAPLLSIKIYIAPTGQGGCGGTWTWLW